MTGLMRDPSVPAVAIRALIGEGGACAGIDIQAAHRAPPFEFLWVDYCPNDGPARGFDFALVLFSDLFPALEACRENVGISHDVEDARVIFFTTPCDPDDLSGLKEFHSIDPFERVRVVRQAAVASSRLPVSTLHRTGFQIQDSWNPARVTRPSCLSRAGSRAGMVPVRATYSQRGRCCIRPSNSTRGSCAANAPPSLFNWRAACLARRFLPLFCGSSTCAGCGPARGKRFGRRGMGLMSAARLKCGLITLEKSKARVGLRERGHDYIRYARGKAGENKPITTLPDSRSSARPVLLNPPLRGKARRAARAVPTLAGAARRGPFQCLP